MPNYVKGQHEWVTKRDPSGEPYQECVHCAVRFHWPGARSACANASLSKWRISSKAKARAEKKAQRAAQKAQRKAITEIIDSTALDPTYHEIK